jgi:hypothetical protein
LIGQPGAHLRSRGILEPERNRPVRRTAQEVQVERSRIAEVRQRDEALPQMQGEGRHWGNKRVHHLSDLPGQDGGRRRPAVDEPQPRLGTHAPEPGRLAIHGPAVALRNPGAPLNVSGYHRDLKPRSQVHPKDTSFLRNPVAPRHRKAHQSIIPAPPPT